MTYFHEPVQDQAATIVTPIVTQVLRALKDAWFYDKDTEIVYTDHTGHQPVIGSRVGSSSDDIRLDVTKRIEAKVVTTPLDDYAFTNNPNAFRGPPVWENKDIPASLNLARYQTRFALTLKYTAPSKADVNNWLNLYHSRVGMGHGSLNLPVSYEVMVPNIVPLLIKTIHTQWEEVAQSGIAFETFLGDSFKVPFTIQQAPNLANSRTLVLTERLENVGVAIPSDLPTPTIVNGNAWEAELSLEFDINVPSMFLFKYSEFVAGKWLPDWCFDKSRNRNAVQRRSYSNGVHADIVMGYLLDKQQVPLYRKNAYIFPQYDTGDVDISKYPVNPVLQVRLSVDPANPRYIVDLNTLSTDIGIKLHPDLMEFLKSRGETAFITGEAMFSIGIARDGELLTPKYFIDEAGILRSEYDMDVLGNYHLLISVTDDFPMLSFTESSAAFKYGALFNAAVLYNYPGIDPTLLPPLQEEGEITRGDALELGKRIPTEYTSPNAHMYTASTLIVEAK